MPETAPLNVATAHEFRPSKSSLRKPSFPNILLLESLWRTVRIRALKASTFPDQYPEQHMTILPNNLLAAEYSPQ
jgi:hypothetical protein